MENANETLVTTPEVDETIDLASEEAETPTDDVIDLGSDNTEPEDDDVIEIGDNDEGIALPDTPELNFLGDLKDALKDKPDALKRAQEIEAGFSKLKSKVDQYEPLVQELTTIQKVFQEASSGDYQAVQEVRNLLDEMGIDLEITEPQVQSKRGENSEIEKLKQEVEAMKREKANEAWLLKHSDKIGEAVEKRIGIKPTAAQIMNARKFLPRSGQTTSEQLVEALVQGNPGFVTQLLNRPQKDVPAYMGRAKGESAQSLTAEAFAKLPPEQQLKYIGMA